MEQPLTDNQNIAAQPTPAKRGGLSLGSIVLLIGVAAVAIVFGIALARRNSEVQPQSGPAPDFSITTFDGQPITLSELRGNVVIINFWASWCGPCRDEAPALQAVWERYRERGVVVLGIAYTDTVPNSQAFIEEFGLTYPNGPDIGTEISKRKYHIIGVPETFIIDQQGNVVEFIYAQVNEADLSASIERLLQS